MTYALEDGRLRERAEKTGRSRALPLLALERIALDRTARAHFAYLRFEGGEEILLRSTSFPGNGPEHDRLASFASLVRALIAETVALRPSVELRTVARYPFFLGLMLTASGLAFAGITVIAAIDGVDGRRIVSAALTTIGLIAAGVVALQRGRGQRFTADAIPDGYLS